MASLRLILVIMLTYSTSYFVKSAPSQLSESTEVTPGPEHAIQELENSENLKVTNTSISSSSNSSKIPSSSSNIDTQDVGGPGMDASKDNVNYPAGKDIKKSVSLSNVMALSDDVITDALFTNIDTLQDHLEVCEEGLRQQLRLLSHGKLLQEVVAEEKDYTPRKTDVRNRRNKNDDKFEEDEEDDDTDSAYDADNTSEKDIADEVNAEMMMDNKDGAMSTNINNPPIPETKNEENARRRRSLTGSSNTEPTPVKADNLAQKVVNRLSERLEYLKASLIQCHLLYRQFGQL